MRTAASRGTMPDPSINTHTWTAHANHSLSLSLSFPFSLPPSPSLSLHSLCVRNPSHIPTSRDALWSCARGVVAAACTTPQGFTLHFFLVLLTLFSLQKVIFTDYVLLVQLFVVTKLCPTVFGALRTKKGTYSYRGVIEVVCSTGKVILCLQQTQSNFQIG